MAKKEEPSAEDLGLPEVPVEEAPASAQEEAPVPRRRGRPPGSGKTDPNKSSAPKKSASRKAEDLEGFAKQLQGIHVLISMATGLPEIQIGPDESKMLAKAIGAVTEEYGLSLDGKTGAAIQLFGAAAMVYVPRAFAIKARIAREQAEAEKVAINDFPANLPR